MDVLPTTVLTGFLGSGKTTLLRRALASAAFADTAVVINEVGEIAIDHYLVDFVDGNVLELPGGCLCCAVREDLARTLRDLIDRRDAGTIRPFARIVIETSGLADPAPILYTLGADAMLDARLALSRVVTVVDAQNGAETLARYAEAARQAAVADALVISKTDLAEVSPELSMLIEGLNPGAERIIGRATDDLAAVLLGSQFRRAGESGGPAAAVSSPEAGSRLRGNDGSGEPAAIHAVHTHGIDTFTVILGGAVSRLDFAKALGRLAMTRGTDLLRVKGLVEFADRPGAPAVVQAAQHTLFAPYWLEAWPDTDHRSRIVFIVHDVPRDELLAHFAFAVPSLLHALPPRSLADAPAVHF